MQASAGSAGVSIVDWAGYLPYGPIRGINSANGLSWWTTWDKEYRMTGLMVLRASNQSAILNRLHPIGDGLNLTGVDDTLDNTKDETFTYDAANRLKTASGPYGQRTWAYDLVGNRKTETSVVSGVSTTRSYAYPSTSNRLSTVTAGSSTERRFTYDGAGNPTQDLLRAPNKTLY